MRTTKLLLFASILLMSHHSLMIIVCLPHSLCGLSSSCFENNKTKQFKRSILDLLGNSSSHRISGLTPITNWKCRQINIKSFMCASSSPVVHCLRDDLRIGQEINVIDMILMTMWCDLLYNMKPSQENGITQYQTMFKLSNWLPILACSASNIAGLTLQT